MNIFIFHRDLRISDNLGLINLIKDSKDSEIYLFFIFNEIQLESQNAFFNKNSFNFMLNALKNLSKEIHVNFFQSSGELEVINEVLKNNKIKRIYTNKDYSNFALFRNKELKNFCLENNIIFKEFNDYLFFEPWQIRPKDSPYYKVFTPFWNNVKEKLDMISSPEKTPNFKSLKISNKFSISLKDFDKYFFSIDFPIEAKEVKNIIENIDSNYEENRNILHLDGNQISPAIKFGIISIRQALKWSLKTFNTPNNLFVKQLMWREFFYHFSYLSQKNKQWLFSTNWNKKFNDFEYQNSQDLFELWKKGKTGIPIIDAAMNQINQTGWMHNRSRMIVASFLTKNLLIDWRWGEKYFAQKLVDYDPIVNQMSWQWSAGCGVDAQPFVRIFNPFLQATKFDKDNKYISSFLPSNYSLKPVVDVKESSDIAKKIFYKLKQ